MNDWAKFGNKFLVVFNKRPKMILALAFLIVGGAISYLELNKPTLKVDALRLPAHVNSTGSNNQVTGTNNGIMTQTNK